MHVVDYLQQGQTEGVSVVPPRTFEHGIWKLHGKPPKHSLSEITAIKGSVGESRGTKHKQATIFTLLKSDHRLPER